MFKLSKLTDYAFVVLTHMVRVEGQQCTAQDIADKTRLPHPTVAKVLKLLAKGGVVAAQRGASGGYNLSRSPREITVEQVITAIDGPLLLTDCVDGAQHMCSHQNACAVNGRWNKVNRALSGALSSVSLYDMACDTPPYFTRGISPAKEINQ